MAVRGSVKPPHSPLALHHLRLGPTTMALHTTSPVFLFSSLCHRLSFHRYISTHCIHTPWSFTHSPFILHTRTHTVSLSHLHYPTTHTVSRPFNVYTHTWPPSAPLYYPLILLGPTPKICLTHMATEHCLWRWWWGGLHTCPLVGDLHFVVHYLPILSALIHCPSVISKEGRAYVTFQAAHTLCPHPTLSHFDMAHTHDYLLSLLLHDSIWVTFSVCGAHSAPLSFTLLAACCTYMGGMIYLSYSTLTPLHTHQPLHGALHRPLPSHVYTPHFVQPT